MGDSLRNKTENGMKWGFIDNIVGQCTSFIVGIVLARLLSPEDFGLIGMTTIFISISSTLVDSGLGCALIRKKESDNLDYNTVFYTNIAVSILLCLLLFFCAPLIARFFERSVLTQIIRVLSLGLIINAFSMIHGTILSKEVNFKDLTKVSITCSIIGGIIGIIMAVKGFGVWSLVVMQLSKQLIYMVAMWTINRWRPTLSFSKQRFCELFGFGSKLLASSLINTIWGEIYNLVIGKCYSPNTLGQYSRATQFVKIFSSTLTGVVQRVSFPALSIIQDENTRLREAFRKMLKVTMLTSFACTIGIAAVAKPMVLVLVGEKWLPCVPFVQILCVSFMLYPLHAMNLNILEVKGRSDLFLKLEILKKFVEVVPILLGIFINIYWMLCSSIITCIITYFMNSHYSKDLIGYSSSEQLRDVMPAFLCSAVMGCIVFPISFLPISVYIILPLQIIIGIIIEIILCKLFRLEEYTETISILKGFICQKKQK